MAIRFVTAPVFRDATEPIDDSVAIATGMPTGALLSPATLFATSVAAGVTVFGITTLLSHLLRGK